MRFGVWGWPPAGELAIEAFWLYGIIRFRGDALLLPGTDCKLGLRRALLEEASPTFCWMGRQSSISSSFAYFCQACVHWENELKSEFLSTPCRYTPGVAAFWRGCTFIFGVISALFLFMGDCYGCFCRLSGEGPSSTGWNECCLYIR